MKIRKQVNQMVITFDEDFRSTGDIMATKLLGLENPTKEEVVAFFNEKAPNVYEDVVEDPDPNIKHLIAIEKSNVLIDKDIKKFIRRVGGYGYFNGDGIIVDYVKGEAYTI